MFFEVLIYLFAYIKHWHRDHGYSTAKGQNVFFLNISVFTDLASVIRTNVLVTMLTTHGCMQHATEFAGKKSAFLPNLSAELLLEQTREPIEK